VERCCTVIHAARKSNNDKIGPNCKNRSSSIRRASGTQQALEETYHRAEVRAVARNDAAAIAIHGTDATAAVWGLWWAAGVGLLAAPSFHLRTRLIQRHCYRCLRVR
jgi:hypothetical protein